MCAGNINKKTTNTKLQTLQNVLLRFHQHSTKSKKIIVQLSAMFLKCDFTTFNTFMKTQLQYKIQKERSMDLSQIREQLAPLWIDFEDNDIKKCLNCLNEPLGWLDLRKKITQQYAVLEKDFFVPIMKLDQKKRQEKLVYEDSFIILLFYKLIKNQYGIKKKQSLVIHQHLVQFLKNKNLSDLEPCVKTILQATENYDEDAYKETLTKIKTSFHWQILNQLWNKSSQKKQDVPINPKEYIIREKKYTQKSIQQLENIIKDMPKDLPERILYQSLIEMNKAKVQILSEQKQIQQASLQKFDKIWRKKLQKVTERLSKQLDQSSRKQKSIENLLKKLVNIGRNENEKLQSAISTLLSIKSELIPLDVPELQRLIKKAELAKIRISGKNIVLIIGKSGVGKTTFILKSLGYKLVQTKFNGMNTFITNQPLKPQHQELRTGPQSQSITRYIFAAKIPNQMFSDSVDKTQTYICDSPGFGDSAGIQVDIANGVGVIDAIKDCNSVLPIVIVSQESFGDRGEGIKEIGHIISQLFKNFENVKQSMSVVFNKFSQQQFQQLPAKLQDIVNNIERIPSENSNQQFKQVMNFFNDQAKDKNQKIFHPITSDHKQLISKKRKNRITDPENHFTYSFADKAKSALKVAYKYFQNVIGKTFKQKKYHLTTYYLKNLLKLKCIVKCDALKSYQDSIGNIQESAKSLVSKIESGLKKIKQQDNLVGREMLKEIKQCQTQLKEMAKLSDFVEQINDYIQNTDQRIKQCSQQLLAKLKNSKSEQFVQLVGMNLLVDQVFQNSKEKQINEIYFTRQRELAQEINSKVKSEEYKQLMSDLDSWILITRKPSKKYQKILVFKSNQNINKFKEQIIKNIQEKISYYQKNIYLILGIKKNKGSNIQQQTIKQIKREQAINLNKYLIKLKEIEECINCFIELANPLFKTMTFNLCDKIRFMISKINDLTKEDERTLDELDIGAAITSKNTLFNLVELVDYVKQNKSDEIQNCFQSLKRYIKKQSELIEDFVSALKQKNLQKIERRLLTIRKVSDRIKKFGSEESSEILGEEGESFKLNYIKQIITFLEDTKRGIQKNQISINDQRNSGQRNSGNIPDIMKILELFNSFKEIGKDNLNVSNLIREIQASVVNKLSKPLKIILEQVTRIVNLNEQSQQDQVLALKKYSDKLQNMVIYTQNNEQQQSRLPLRLREIKAQIVGLVAKKIKSFIIKTFNQLKELQTQAQSLNPLGPESQSKYLGYSKFIRSVLGLLQRIMEKTEIQRELQDHFQTRNQVDQIKRVIYSIKNTLYMKVSSGIGSSNVHIFHKIKSLCEFYRQIEINSNQNQLKFIKIQNLCLVQIRRYYDNNGQQIKCTVNEDSIQYKNFSIKYSELSRDTTPAGIANKQQIQGVTSRFQIKLIRKIRNFKNSLNYEDVIGPRHCDFVKLIFDVVQAYEELTKIYQRQQDKDKLITIKKQEIQQFYGFIVQKLFKQYATLASLISIYKLVEFKAKYSSFQNFERSFSIQIFPEWLQLSKDQNYKKKLSEPLQFQFNLQRNLEENLQLKQSKNKEHNENFLHKKLQKFHKQAQRKVENNLLKADDQSFQINESSMFIYENLDKREKQQMNQKIKMKFEGYFKNYQSNCFKSVGERQKAERKIIDQINLLRSSGIKTEIRNSFITMKKTIEARNQNTLGTIRQSFQSKTLTMRQIIENLQIASRTSNQPLMKLVTDYFYFHYQQIEEDNNDQIVDEEGLKTRLIKLVKEQVFNFIDEKYDRIFKIYPELQKVYLKSQRSIINRFTKLIKRFEIQLKQIYNENKVQKFSSKIKKDVNYQQIIDNVFLIYGELTSTKNRKKLMRQIKPQQEEVHIEEKIYQKSIKEVLSEFTKSVVSFTDCVWVAYKELTQKMDPKQVLHASIMKNKLSLRQAFEQSVIVDPIFQKVFQRIESINDQNDQVGNMKAKFEKLSNISQNFTKINTGLNLIKEQVESFQFFNDYLRNQSQKEHQIKIDKLTQKLEILEVMSQIYLPTQKNEIYRYSDLQKLLNDKVQQQIVTAMSNIKKGFQNTYQENLENVNVIMSILKVIANKVRPCFKCFKKETEDLKNQIRDNYKDLQKLIYLQILKFSQSISSYKQDLIIKENQRKKQQTEIKKKYKNELENEIRKKEQEKDKQIRTAISNEQKESLQKNKKTEVHNINIKFKDLETKDIRALQQRFILMTDETNYKKKHVTIIAERLIIYKKMTLNIFFEQRRYTDTLNIILKKYQTDLTKKNLNVLIDHMESIQNQTLPQQLMNDHQIFKDRMGRKFIVLTQNQGIDYVLRALKGSIDKLNLQSTKKLKTCYELYKKAFDEEVKIFQKNATDFTKNNLVEKIKYQANRLKQFYKSNQSHVGNKINLIAWIFALWTIIRAQVTDDHVEYAYQPHAAQIVTIFLLIGLGFQTEEQKVMSNRMAQVGTGEGKSVVLAGLSTYLALVGFKVCCACYSQYLSTRDSQAFSDLFEKLGVQRSITYGTFNEHSQKLLNSEQNESFRDSVKEIIINREGGLWEWLPNFITDRLRKIFNAVIFSNKSRDQKSILIIDEVDVFFDKSFFGNLYVPAISLECKDVKNLLKYVWTAVKKNPKVTPDQIRESQQFKIIKVKYQSIKSILKNQVNAMINGALKHEHDYYIVDNKLVYKDQDGITDKINFGYKTVFAHCYQNDLQKISPSSYENSLKITLAVAEFSYALLPTYFKHILGVTGTLQVMPKYKKNELEQSYKVKENFIIPSVYGDNNKGDQNKRRDQSYTIVTPKDHYKQIVARFEGIHQAGRPVVIFFRNKKEIDNFFQSEQFKPFMPHSCSLTQQHDAPTRNQRITRATEKKRITIMTQSFGRGTDFVIYQKNIAEEGLHIVQTFLSTELSEQIQIKGRTARQGKKGSYVLVIPENDLQLLEITKKKENTTMKDIEAARNKKQNEECNQINTLLTNSQKCHKNCMSIYGQRERMKKKELIEYVAKLNKTPQISKKNVRVVMALDATCSMTNALAKVLNILDLTFGRAYQILTKKKDEGTFEMQMLVYRNYNCDAEDIISYSPFQNTPQNLKNFLKTVHPKGGMGNEAIEVALQHINTLKNVDQIIIIGDAAANTTEQTKQRRKQHRKKNYWEQNNYPLTNFDDQLKKIKDKKIPIHSFYLGADSFFNKISSSTQGQGQQFNIRAPKASEDLAEFIVTKILKQVGGAEKGEDYAKQYRKTYNR